MPFDEAWPAAAPLVLNPSAPLESAREFIHRHHSEGADRTLHHQNGTFFSWLRTHYTETTVEEMRARLYRFLDKARRLNAKNECVPFDPNKVKVANVLEALGAEAQLGASTKPPTWLNDEAWSGDDLLSCSNGLVHLPTRIVLPHNPAFFNLNALPFAYSPDAPKPHAWLNFLAELWPDDAETISALQEMFGLLLTGDTRQQKAFMLVGPRRCGKGTIARTLMALLGKANVCGPTLSSFGQNFGLMPLIGKRLALISDARLGKADQSIIVERILSITGEDTLTIDRKNRDPWTGQLEARIVLLTNELPRLTDVAGAFASRFVLLVMKNSFFGREDHGLGERILSELPGILNWSLDGLDRLRSRGRFVIPQSSTEAQAQLEDLGSPIGAFLRDRCEIDAGRAVECQRLFDAWCGWCRDNSRDHVGSVQVFGRDLRAAVPGLAVIQPRSETGPRLRYYQGLDLNH